MKSDICTLPEGTKDLDSLSAILSEVEKTAEYVELDKKQAARLRLLAEELVEMLPSVLSYASGKFWVESQGKSFELHTSLMPNELMTSERREQLLSLSTSGENAAVKGIMSKIFLAVELMAVNYEAVANMTPASTYEFYHAGITTIQPFVDNAWSLETYRRQAEKQQGEAWDELEKSIVANIADDVVVGVTGRSVEIVVKKSF